MTSAPAAFIDRVHPLPGRANGHDRRDQRPPGFHESEDRPSRQPAQNRREVALSIRHRGLVFLRYGNPKSTPPQFEPARQAVRALPVIAALRCAGNPTPDAE